MMIQDETAEQWLNRTWPFPCKSCACPNTGTSEDTLCRECYDKTPEAIAKREQDAKELADYKTRLVEQKLSELVSPEIMETDTEHPDFNLDAWERITRGWNDESRDWLWLHSKTSGRCKSRIAYLLLRRLYLRAIEPLVIRAGSYNGKLPTILWVDGDRLTEAFRTRHQFSLGDSVMGAAHDLVEKARTCRFLVIDDLSKRKLTGEAASDGLWEIIKRRHEWKLVTIITDNFLPEALEDTLHEKHAPYIIRRLVERCIQVDFDATASESQASGQWSESQQGES
jgi:hypothetical protein